MYGGVVVHDLLSSESDMLFFTAHVLLFERMYEIVFYFFILKYFFKIYF